MSSIHVFRMAISSLILSWSRNRRPRRGFSPAGVSARRPSPSGSPRQRWYPVARVYEDGHADAMLLDALQHLRLLLVCERRNLTKHPAERMNFHYLLSCHNCPFLLGAGSCRRCVALWLVSFLVSVFLSLTTVGGAKGPKKYPRCQRVGFGGDFDAGEVTEVCAQPRLSARVRCLTILSSPPSLHFITVCTRRRLSLGLDRRFMWPSA